MIRKCDTCAPVTDCPFLDYFSSVESVRFLEVPGWLE